MVLETIVGLGIAIFLFMFLSSQLEKEHFLLKLLILFVIMAVLILIPKTLLDSQTTCEAVVNNSTANGSVIYYEYTSFCYTLANETTQTFYNSILWFYRLFIIYVLIYLGYKAIVWLNESFQSRGRK